MSSHEPPHLTEDRPSIAVPFWKKSSFPRAHDADLIRGDFALGHDASSTTFPVIVRS